MLFGCLVGRVVVWLFGGLLEWVTWLRGRVAWLAGWLAGWLVGSLVGWLVVGWLIVWLVG